MVIDLRSDTVTRPSAGMREAMMCADIGDDVLDGDPTVRRLESMLADMTGMEAAIFAPSGTMSNLMGLMSHCERGDEYIVGQTAHTYVWEGGGAAVLGSIQPQPLEFAADGSIPLHEIAGAIKPLEDYHPRTRLLCLENTVAGLVLPLDYISAAGRLCDERGLAYHCDGARLFNAAVKLGIPVGTISANFDSVSICLSKGLGGPMGSVLCGSSSLIRKARRWRKVLGGGMRQVGTMAAAAIYALTHNVQRLAEDHDNARKLAVGLSRIDGWEVDLTSVQTNMVFARFNGQGCKLHSYLQDQGILLLEGQYCGSYDGVRFVTHLDVSASDIDVVINAVEQFHKFV